MKINLEFDDDSVIAEALDAMVVSHLRSSKNTILTYAFIHPDDVANDAEVIDAIDVLIKYYAGEDDGEA